MFLNFPPFYLNHIVVNAIPITLYIWNLTYFFGRITKKLDWILQFYLLKNKILISKFVFLHHKIFTGKLLNVISHVSTVPITLISNTKPCIKIPLPLILQRLILIWVKSAFCMHPLRRQSTKFSMPALKWAELETLLMERKGVAHTTAALDLLWERPDLTRTFYSREWDNTEETRQRPEYEDLKR